MKDFFLFNFLGIASMMLGIYCIVELGDSIGVFLSFIGLCSILVGYKCGFKANK